MNSGRAATMTLAIVGAAGLAACDTVKTNLLEAVNPSIIDPSSTNAPVFTYMGGMQMTDGAT